MNPQEVLSALEWRYAVKKFDPDKKISPENWKTLEEVLRLSPSSFGLQLWKFLVIDSPEIRRKLQPHAWNQDQVVTASHLVVFAHKTLPTELEVEEHLKNISSIRKTPLENLEPYRTRITDFIKDDEIATVLPHWTARQCYLALGFFMSACATLKIDTCPMEGFDKEKVDEILDLPAQGLSATVLCGAGYRSAEDPYQAAKKVRFPLGSIVKHI